MAYKWLRSISGGSHDVIINDALNLSNFTEDFCFSILVQSAAGSNDNVILMTSENQGPYAEIHLEKNCDTGNLIFWLQTNSVGPVRPFSIESSVKSIEDNLPHFITINCKRSSPAKCRLYIDGVLDTEVDAVGDPAVAINIDAFRIGYNFIGYIDQFIFHKGITLTDEQVAAIYNDGVGAKISESDIEALSPAAAFYAELDEGEGDPTGRFYNGEAWSDSGMTLTGEIEWVEGGIPFSRIVTSSAGTGGTISPSGETEIALGEDQEFTATPAAGYEVNQWLIDEEVIHEGGQVHTIRDISEDHTIAVSFAAITRQLCTLTDIKDRLGIGSTDTEYDSVINRIILGIEEIFNNETGRKLLMTNADVTEYYTGGCPYLQLNNYPVISITSIKEDSLYAFVDELALVENTDYRLVREGKNGVVYRLSFKWSDFEDAIQIIYRSGYCGADETPGTGEHALPADLREAAIMQATFIYKRRDDIGLSSVSAMGGSISKFSSMDLLPLVKETLKKYQRPQL